MTAIDVGSEFRVMPLPPRACRVAPLGPRETRLAASLGSIVLGPDDLAIEIAEYWYADAEIDGAETPSVLEVGWATVAQVISGPDRMRQLEERRRLGIYRWRLRRDLGYFVELKIVHWDPERPGNLGTAQAPTLGELDTHLAGGSSEAIFAALGATQGSRESLIEDLGRRRGVEAVAFREFDTRVPTIALTLGAVVPFWAMHGSDRDDCCP